MLLPLARHQDQHVLRPVHRGHDGQFQRRTFRRPPKNSGLAAQAGNRRSAEQANPWRPFDNRSLSSTPAVSSVLASPDCEHGGNWFATLHQALGCEAGVEERVNELRKGPVPGTNPGANALACP